MEQVWKDPEFVELVIKANYQPYPWIKDEKANFLRMKMSLPDDQDLVVEYKSGEYMLLLAHGIQKKSPIPTAMRHMKQAITAMLSSRPNCSFRYSPENDESCEANKTPNKTTNVIIYGWGDMRSIIELMEKDRKNNMVMQTITEA